jgi:hypothetical protein
MQEGRRQGYLAALGLPLWVSRHRLPGAPPAEALDFVPYEDEAPAVAFAAEPEPAPLPVAEKAAVPVVREAPPVQRPRQPDVAPATAPVAAVLGGNAEFPRFTFWFKPLASGWQLLIALGDVPDLSAREHQLLEQIEAVLDGGPVAPMTFNWPLNNNPAIPRDARSAREAVAAFLARQRKPGARYLLLGQELLPYMQAAFGAEKYAVGDSLPLLLAEPLRKRALWQSLGVALG